MSTILLFPENDCLLLLDDGVAECAHKNAYIEPPCCIGVDCACNGMSSFACPAYDCTGITKRDEKLLANRLVWSA